MLWDYRTERWWYIIANILEKALKCAYLTASIQDYVCLCLEILSNNVQMSIAFKKRIYENLLRLLKVIYVDMNIVYNLLHNYFSLETNS